PGSRDLLSSHCGRVRLRRHALHAAVLRAARRADPPLGRSRHGGRGAVSRLGCLVRSCAPPSHARARRRVDPCDSPVHLDARDGRALASFAAAAAGGMRPAYALSAPLWFLRSAAQDPVSLIVLAGASVYAVARLREGNAGFAPAYFVLAAVFTLLIFTSPGTDTNHFLDVLGAAALLLGDQLTRQPRRARLALGVP